MPNLSLVKVATYDDPIIAHLSRNRLETAGITAFLDGEHHIAMDWMIANAVGGVKLLVAADDAEQAAQILSESLSSENVSPTGPDRTDKLEREDCCPACGSGDTHRERLHRKLIFLSILLLGVPLPFVSRKIACSSCGHRWNGKQT
ncbi:putative signal transducing protein [Mariniblastus fucicola]|uniref:DUF2007 domain-containing protein n=1 Tax=Mariniblastus fucicola TaxID=980251 RepID=A0A5B9PAI3_9BACT|nr:DUF2007 domain-containing protein [Mariniblastus fucicola]QEG21506.1 hypothetical protein MFFC18_13620 [Mariniblastus fucicola]